MTIKLKDMEDRPEGSGIPAATDTSLTQQFKELAARNTEALAPLRPTLARLNEIVTRFQEEGHDAVGVEFASFSSLRALNLLQRTGAEPQQFSILTVYDAKFLVRLHGDCKIDCYRDNLNKPLPLQVLDSEEFWYKTERSTGGTVKVLKNEPRFDRYDLNNPDDEAKFMSCIIETAAACAALNTLREFDLPASRPDAIQKPIAPVKVRKP
jgi:hypothetical protein